jgi:hypothetical protein
MESKWNGEGEFAVVQHFRGKTFKLNIWETWRLLVNFLPVEPFVVEDRDGQMVIMMPLEWFQAFTREEMRVIYWHEVGHLVAGHLDSDCRTRTLQREHEADMLSVEKMGVDMVIHVLLKVMSMMDTAPEGREEILSRIKLIFKAKG